MVHPGTLSRKDLREPQGALQIFRRGFPIQTLREKMSTLGLKGSAYVLGTGLGKISFLRLSSSLGSSVLPAGNLLKLRI
jgi:hypothetical protein